MPPIKSWRVKSRPLGKGWGPRDVAVRQGCWVDMLQEEEPLPGTKSRLLYSTWKWIIRGDTCHDKARDFTGKGCSGGKQWGEGNWKNSSAMWLAVSGFMVMGLVSRLSVANHSDLGSFLVACTSLSQDGFQWEGFWESIWTGVASLPFDHSQILPVGYSLLVPCSLSGPPVLR